MTKQTYINIYIYIYIYVYICMYVYLRHLRVVNSEFLKQRFDGCLFQVSFYLYNFFIIYNLFYIYIIFTCSPVLSKSGMVKMFFNIFNLLSFCSSSCSYQLFSVRATYLLTTVAVNIDSPKIITTPAVTNQRKATPPVIINHNIMALHRI